MPLLTQNRELKPHGIYNFAIPAWFVRRATGELFVTCPNAGACAKVCYARNGTYTFKNVKAAHTRNLELVLNDPALFREKMLNELAARKFRPTGITRQLPAGVSISTLDPWMRRWVHHGGKAVRIHDSGDFFNELYLRLWVNIAECAPDVLFYAYTKEVLMFKAFGPFPPNFRYLFSTGGLQDSFIEPGDRHADVFPDKDAIAAAGYTSQDASDLLAIMLPTDKIGIPANNIPHFNKRIAGRRFSEM